MTDSMTNNTVGNINNTTQPLQQPTTQPNNIIIRNKKTHVNYFNNNNNQLQQQERLPSISEWFAQPSTKQDNFHTTSQQTIEFASSNCNSTNNYHQTQLTNNSMIVRNRSISNGTTNGSQTIDSVSQQSNITQQNKFPHSNGRGKAPHSRVRSVPPVMMGNTSYLNTNNQILSPNNTDIITSFTTNNLHPATTSSSTAIHTNSGAGYNSCNNFNICGNSNNCNTLIKQSSPLPFNNGNTSIFQTVVINSQNHQKSSTPSTPTSQPLGNESKNDFVLVIENEESIKQYSERASLHNPNPFNPLSRRISAKEVWNSIAAATQANKIISSNSPKIKKSNKMSNSIHAPSRNRSFSPTSSSNTCTNLTQNSNQSSLPLSSITIRSRKRSNSNPLVLPFDKLSLDDSEKFSQKQSNTENSDQLHLLGNEFVDFSNGEHESQRKNRGEKVFKFKMINF
ncbi:predicted protein [Naegleria gruberi]|uniref:Predicted protein n=1 Tax=Naegleria gruberi TaxID=5762 RepID=D2UXE5_NAEGR|nr:uncharacterized protein NAEGRDRAFT_44925 [Naegleria gruberi]EFC50618.1 predicted protein [Naegleria gruberi]|eukprot:XP_002683362.1 predicted protein [Naegleria gruberi strain NEG-M]